MMVYRNDMFDLKEYRKTKGLSQHEFAGIVGTTQNNVCRMEKGTLGVGMITLKKIANAFDEEIVVIVSPD